MALFASTGIIQIYCCATCVSVRPDFKQLDLTPGLAIVVAPIAMGRRQTVLKGHYQLGPKVEAKVALVSATMFETITKSASVPNITKARQILRLLALGLSVSLHYANNRRKTKR